MNLLHIYCLVGVFVVSCIMNVTVILLAPMNRWSLLVARLAGCSAVLSIAGLWIGLIYLLITSLIN